LVELIYNQTLRITKHFLHIALKVKLLPDYCPPIEPDKKLDAQAKSYFIINSMGFGTRRDAWVYNSSLSKLIENIKNHIEFYNKQVDEYREALKTNPSLKQENIRNTHL
jgi:predicted helicase